MRKLHKVALAATMVGSLSMFGAGVASAHDGYKSYDSHKSYDKKSHKDDGDVIVCDQDYEVENPTFQEGIVNLSNINLLSSTATSTAVTQNCGKDIESGNVADAESGDVEDNEADIEIETED
ncbi:hypothetical protein [Streptomyces sp. 8N706]|uniref:hypothetical protein n=1 Tax=Streptomyces sp. 8N706 TaxID=3457416 RepID=UPI003FD46364